MVVDAALLIGLGVELEVEAAVCGLGEALDVLAVEAVGVGELGEGLEAEVEGDGAAAGKADIVVGAYDGVVCAAVPQCQSVAELLVVRYQLDHPHQQEYEAYVARQVPRVMKARTELHSRRQEEGSLAVLSERWRVEGSSLSKLF